MASPLREQDPVLNSPILNSLGERFSEVAGALFSDPNGFDFFQAVRLLQLLQPHRSPVGEFAHPRKEAVRFSAHPSLSFPASAIQSLSPPADPNAPPDMQVNFMGLIGPLGVLPNYYTELVADRARSHDTTLAAFFDIFQHRAISLFYRAWERSHFAVGYERDHTDLITARLLDFVGLGLAPLQSRQNVRDETVLYYSGLFGLQSRSALALESIISDYFDVPAEIEQFVGTWRSLDTADQCCFDSGPWESRSLGLGAVAGDEIWDRQSRARIRIGPLLIDRYRDFLPQGADFEALRTLVRFYGGYDVEFELLLILKQNDVPPCELGDDAGYAQLGWLTWMKSGSQFDRNPGDTVLLFDNN